MPPPAVNNRVVEPIGLTLMTRTRCHLCEEMAQVVEAVAREFPVRLETRDVDEDEALRNRYGLEVPVLLVNGRKAFKYRVTAAELRRRLRAEQRRFGRAAWRRMFEGKR